MRGLLVFLMQFVFMLFVIYCLLIVMTFAEMFLFNLRSISQERENDAWLQARCKEQEFLHLIRHHMDLCEKVEGEATTNAYLVATQQALDGFSWLNITSALTRVRAHEQNTESFTVITIRYILRRILLRIHTYNQTSGYM